MAAPPTTVPCEPWTTPEEVRECCGGLDPAFDLTRSIAFATAILFRLSGRQFPGECERTLWPCKGSNCGCCGDWAGGDWWWTFQPYPAWPVPNGAGDGFVNLGRCDRACSLNCVKLPATINEIVDVTVDGVTLDPSDYKIDAYRRLCRVDGGSWPCTNDLTGEPGDPGVWTITYNYGKPVPDDGRYAASLFACELARARCGADSCLPQRIKSISRQDVDVDFWTMDPMEFLEQGKVGIYEVDLWIGSVNPSHIKRRARLHRPDRGHTNRKFT